MLSKAFIEGVRGHRAQVRVYTQPARSLYRRTTLHHTVQTMVSLSQSAHGFKTIRVCNRRQVLSLTK
jgi:hypothetical protein